MPDPVSDFEALRGDFEDLKKSVSALVGDGSKAAHDVHLDAALAKLEEHSATLKSIAEWIYANGGASVLTK
jgi:hypothetical protein